MNASIVSIVIATHNRLDSLRDLIGDLARQTVSTSTFEVIVVDDESPVPVPTNIRGAIPADHFTLLRVPRGGPGAARNAGARVACGFVVIFVDDDMRLPANFIASHLAHYRPHRGPVVVLGNIQPDAEIAEMPLFERYHARQLARFQANVAAGTVTPRGVHLCTGNVSMRLIDFLDVGGFDVTLSRSEDRDLGIRLAQRGCRFVYGQEAVSMHGSDHRDPTVWRRRNELYGRADLIIARKHPTTADIHPWRFWSLIPAFGRPLALITLLVPAIGQVLASVVFAIARALDLLGAHRSAVALTGLTYCLDYFRGLRREAGSLLASRPLRPSMPAPALDASSAAPTVATADSPRAARPTPTMAPNLPAASGTYHVAGDNRRVERSDVPAVATRSGAAVDGRRPTPTMAPALPPSVLATPSHAHVTAPATRDAHSTPVRAAAQPAVQSVSQPAAPARGGLVGGWHAFRDAVHADYNTMRAHRAKYHANDRVTGGLGVNLVRKVGLQLLAAYRLMRFFDACRVPLAPQVMSRLIRHLYGAEIHWKARIAPGVSVVHGVGLVLSHAAEVSAGCILFQGVTLGESVHPVTGAIGAPRLEAGVHVGPGATILGPVTIGAGSKVMAGAVVTHDVPPRSLVSTPAPQVSRRAPRVAALTPSLAM